MPSKLLNLLILAFCFFFENKCRSHRANFKLIFWFFNLLNLLVKHVFDVRYICLIDQSCLSEIPLLLRLLLCQDVAFKSMLSFDFSRTGELETFLSTRYGLLLWHDLFVLLVVYYFFFGLIIMIIRLPSNLGSCSTAPKSANSFAKRRSKISPRSLKTIVRPLKNT